MLILMAAASLLLAETTPAADPARPVAAEAKPEKPKKPKMICTEEAQIGTVFRKRVCRTAEEADAERRAAERTNQAIGDHYAVCRAGNC